MQSYPMGGEVAALSPCIWGPLDSIGKTDYWPLPEVLVLSVHSRAEDVLCRWSEDHNLRSIAMDGGAPVTWASLGQHLMLISQAVPSAERASSHPASGDR